MAPNPASAFSRLIALLSALRAVTPHSTESPVSILWTNICIVFFPLASGFKFYNKQTVRHPNQEVDCVILQVSAVTSSFTDPQEKVIRIMQCKRPSKDTPEWESARAQLAQYCEGNANRTSRIFGATAIGTKVRFWRYDHLILAPLIPEVDTCDFVDGNSGYQAERCLEYIRGTGWDWAQSGVRLPSGGEGGSD
ncbi:hypothetical protein BO94DRAFT_536954 [Aspergillus sclerotioniger CBS 115572]|uniref:Fungal-type protein kinase domain-containing protein n=1 Tax=Aspergillus sclerotioniger CBS 115572 TaxID=1450535 RepID=A0A317W7A2_9EURO|nr:hypothetical protein BO94DRAFT_536954 [Aspergillus sclerotioniger CBS 115572]PWY81765.1 hypothetical protein BO94DRAFT_536954 [Aspergillus sclerotioniger CBS 115572]